MADSRLQFFCSERSPFYHEYGCLYLGDAFQPVTVAEIGNLGLIPCHVCGAHAVNIQTAPFVVDLEAFQAEPVPAAVSLPAPSGGSGSPEQHAMRGFHIDSRAVVAEEAQFQRCLSYEHHGATIARTGILPSGMFNLPREETDAKRIALHVLQQALPPAVWDIKPGAGFTMVDHLHLGVLCSHVSGIIMREPIVTRVQAPCKVFGDIHGQFGNLLDFFRLFGSPNHHTGDVTYVNYVFDGDFVDRGENSLEVITLLMALKTMYPKKITLIRGNHEDAEINANYGFRNECETRLPLLAGKKVWDAVNGMFDRLPLAAVIEDSIFVCHGGLGASITKISQIENLKRPLVIGQLQEGTPDYNVVMDLLWSDPTSKDTILGVHPNTDRGTGLTKFGPDRVREFCRQNNLALMIRAHECVEAGYEFFAEGRLITVFSATNYCGQHDNAGAMLIIDRELNVQPRVITGRRHTWPVTQYRPPSPMRPRPQGQPVPESPNHFTIGNHLEELEALLQDAELRDRSPKSSPKLSASGSTGFIVDPPPHSVGFVNTSPSSFSPLSALTSALSLTRSANPAQATLSSTSPGRSSPRNSGERARSPTSAGSSSLTANELSSRVGPGHAHK